MTKTHTCGLTPVRLRILKELSANDLRLTGSWHAMPETTTENMSRVVRILRQKLKILRTDHFCEFFTNYVHFFEPIFSI